MTTASLDQLKTLLGEDFDDVRPLGEDGGMSRLFRAHKRSLDLDVVVKRMRMDPSCPADVRREAKVMTGLRHQFLPRIFDFKTDGEGYCYTIMELIPGCTLRQYVQRCGALGQKQALFWMRQLCEAAEYMHSQRPPILHSDIKPENIMVTPEGNLCLIDFNAALELRDDGVEAVGATMCYAAPEQYNIPLERFGPVSQLTPERRAVYDMAAAAQSMGKVTVRTDLYAIGAVTYFMLTGYDPPCWNQPPVPLSRFAIQLSDPFLQVIERCMALEPGRRFAGAGEVLRALGGMAKLDSRYKAWRRTSQAAALVVGAGLIFSAFAMVWGWMLLGQETGQSYNQLIQEAQQLEAQMDYQGQQEVLLEAIALERNRPEAYANLGALLYRQGDYDQAVELLSQVDVEDTGTLEGSEAAAAYGQIQYVLGSCYYQLEDYAKALQAYQLSSVLCPEEPAYCRDLAVCCARLGYSDQAQEALTRLEQLAPGSGDSQLAAGEIAYFDGRYEEAYTLLEEVARLSEDVSVISRASLQAAQCCQQLGTDWLDQEISLLQSAVGRLGVSDNGAQLQVLAEAWLRKASADASQQVSCWEEALACLQELMARGQATFAVRQNAALTLEYLDRLDEAEEVLLQLQQDFPRDYRPAMRLALLYLDEESGKEAGQRSYDKARQQYEQAETLYAAAPSQDSDMVRLQELMAQLPE